MFVYGSHNHFAPFELAILIHFTPAVDPHIGLLLALFFD
jgi:hypothetical protein